MEADRAVSERYHVLELIGEGSFGRVYKGRKKLSKQVMANTKTRLDRRRLCLIFVFCTDCGVEIHREAGERRRGAQGSGERDRHHEQTAP